jgi:hypothetical protein
MIFSFAKVKRAPALSEKVGCLLYDEKENAGERNIRE